jgi:hypothetical protein
VCWDPTYSGAPDEEMVRVMRSMYGLDYLKVEDYFRWGV